MTKTTKTRTNEDLFRIATFILLDAALFHETLAGVDSTFASIQTARGSLQRFLDKEWTKILKKDYEPIFSLAREVLQSFPSSPNTEAILRRIVDRALAIVSSGILRKHDFLGRVYHKLLLRTTGRFYATYYTSIPSAWLLAHLTFKLPHHRWDFSSPESISTLRVIDPACGSGTLLSASYMAIKDRYVQSCRTALKLGEFHRVLIEDVLHGWDVLDYASHLTLTTLALHSNRSTVDSSNIFTLPAGVDEVGPHLGSLDYLAGQSLLGHGFSSVPEKKGIAGSRRQAIQPPACDVVIMNPPFSRSAKPNVKFGYATPEAKKLLQTALSKLGKDLEATGIGQAGLGAYFMLLGLKLAKDDGRVSIVIPRAILSGVSWGKVRDRYQKRCRLRLIVSNYDTGDAETGVDPWSWSENTDLGEVLILAERGDGSKAHVGYVNLWRKPKNEVESVLLAQQITKVVDAGLPLLADGKWAELRLGGHLIGTLYGVDQDELSRNWLFPCAFAHPELNSLARSVLRVPELVPLDSLINSSGVDIKQVKDNFAESDRHTTNAMVWGHQGAMNTIFMAGSNIGHGRPKKKQSKDMHDRSASAFLIAERPHLSTEALLAMRAPVPVLTTAFWEVSLKRSTDSAALLVWLNSTYGIVAYLASATSSMGDIFKMKKDQLKYMPVIDTLAVDAGEAERLLKVVGSKPFLRYGEEFALAAKGQGARFQLDEFLQSRAKLPSISKSLYEALARDPVVIKQRL
jgi:hypothetical protein